MSDEWTPLDDLGRLEAGLAHRMREFSQARARLEAARARTLASFDRLFATLGDCAVDWSTATDEEAAEMAEALDVIHRARAAVAGAARTTA